MGRYGSIILLWVAACASPAPRTVPRIIDGQLEQGPFISPYTYEWFIDGEVLAAKGRHEEAAIAFENAIAAPADDVLLMTRLAEEYELSGASRRADRMLTLAHRTYPQSARVAIAEGRIQRRRGNDNDALSSFARARKLAPTWDEPVIAIARTLMARGHPQRANAILLSYLETALRPRSKYARHVLIASALRAGDAETLERALALDPSSTPTARAQMAGRLALEVGRPALAVRILADALDTPENTALWLRALMESGQRDEAAAFLARASSERLGGVVEHANLWLEIDEADRALQLLRAAETSPRVEYTRGRARLARGDYVEAATVLATIPVGTASFEGARVAFAECSSSRGRQGAGAEALSLTPHDSLAVRRKLAEIYVEEGDLRAGLRLFDPKRPSDRAALAALLERAGQFEEASAYYASLKVAPSDDPQLRARVSAEQLVLQGHRRGAIAVLEQWTSIAPEDLYARVRLVELLQADHRAQAAEQRGRRTLQVVDDPLLRAHLVDVLDAEGRAVQ